MWYIRKQGVTHNPTPHSLHMYFESFLFFGPFLVCDHIQHLLSCSLLFLRGTSAGKCFSDSLVSPVQGCAGLALYFEGYLDRNKWIYQKKNKKKKRKIYLWSNCRITSRWKSGNNLCMVFWVLYKAWAFSIEISNTWKNNFLYRFYECNPHC